MTPTSIEVTRSSRSRIDERRLDQASFGSVFSDHMVVAEYRDGSWRTIRIEPYGPLALPPTISGLQYGVSVFDAHKAFRTVTDDVVLFRPRDHHARLKRSCQRLVLPCVNEDVYLQGLGQLIGIDRDWVPASDEGSLYIRSCIFATEESIRVRAASSCSLVIVTCPVGPYYAEPLRLLAVEDSVRAFPGGTGDVKPAGNYAPTLLVEVEAQRRGYHGVLWLDGRDHRLIEEAGVMNVFFVIDGTVVTPNLTGTILAGITRDSVITLLSEMGITVEERPISIDEVADAHAAGRLQECFGTGTAATVAHVASIGYHGRDLAMPPVAGREVGPAVLDKMHRLRAGRDPDRFGWLVPL